MLDQTLELILAQAGDYKFTIAISVFLLSALGRLAQQLWKLRSDHADSYQQFVERCLSSPHINPAEKSLLIEEFNSDIFRRITGMTAEPTMRGALSAISTASVGAISVKRPAKARSFLHLVESTTVNIRFTSGAKFAQAFNWAYTAVFVVLSGATLTGALVLTNVPLANRFGLLGACFVFLLFAAFFITQTVPYSTAKELARELSVLRTSAPTEDARSQAAQSACAEREAEQRHAGNAAVAFPSTLTPPAN